MGFEILGGVAWGFIDDLVDVRHVSGRHGQKYIEKLFRISYLTVIAKQSEDTLLTKAFFTSTLVFLFFIIECIPKLTKINQN